MKTYTTISGDTFDKIAKKHLGDEKLAGKIIEANIDYADVIIFESNLTLNIPEIEEAEPELAQDLPPWKRTES